MSFHGTAEFSTMKENLAHLFASTAAQYAENCGLGVLSERALSQMTVPLQDTAAEVLMFGCNAWPDSARTDAVETIRPFEVNASETDPPPQHTALLWSLATLLISTPLAFLLSFYIPGHVGSVFYGFGVMAIAMVFGSRYAALLGLLSPILHNLLDVPPMFTFTWPTTPEEALAAFYMVLAFGVPWMIQQSIKLRYLAIPSMREVAA